MLIVPQQGRARFVTELGIVEAAPGEIAVIPRGLRFRVELPDGPSRGYVCENYGAHVAAAGARAARLERARQSARFSQRRSPRTRTQDSRASVDRQIPGQSVGGGDGSFAAQRRRLARQLRAVQIRPRALHGDRHGELRSSRSVDLHRADRAVGCARHRQYRLRHLPAALAGRRGHVPAALVSTATS